MSPNLERVRARAPSSGRMTAAMRAAFVPNVARALRVAVVVEGRIVEERIFRERHRVSGIVDDRLTLFDVRDGAWMLCIPNGALGHVMTNEGRATLGPIASRVKLDDSARGKIVIGKATVLFQFVVPPPRPSRPQLPLATKRGEVDWALTVIAAFSFLLHFGVIGAMFSDWADPVAATDDVVAIVDMTSKLPAAVVEDRDTSASASTSTATKTSTSKSTSTSTRKNETRDASDARAAALANDAEAMRMSLLVAFGGKAAVQGALDRGDVPVGNLDHSKERVDTTGGELHLATNGQVTIPGSTLNELGETHVTEGTTHERTIEGPKWDMTVTPEPPQGTGDVNIESAIAKLRPSFRSCYQRKGLAVDPAMEGKLTIDIRIAANGDVGDVTKVDGSGLSAAVEQCIIERAHNASFSAPGGSGTHARVPIIFRQQR